MSYNQQIILSSLYSIGSILKGTDIMVDTNVKINRMVFKNV